MQTRANTYRCETCGAGISIHGGTGGPYGCPDSQQQVADGLGLTPEQAARGWDNSRPIIREF